MEACVFVHACLCETERESVGVCVWACVCVLFSGSASIGSHQIFTILWGVVFRVGLFLQTLFLPIRDSPHRNNEAIGPSLSHWEQASLCGRVNEACRLLEAEVDGAGGNDRAVKPHWEEHGVTLTQESEAVSVGFVTFTLSIISPLTLKMPCKVYLETELWFTVTLSKYIMHSLYA